MAEWYTSAQLREMALAEEEQNPPPAILECGHAPSTHSYFCHTYATTADGRKICHDCDQAAKDSRILDCGHTPTTPHSPMMSGTAHAPDGREMCWDCAAKGEIAALLTSNHYHGYTKRETIGTGKYAGLAMGGQIITWTGATLIERAQFWTIGHNWWGTGGKLWCWTGKDAHGQTWYGRCAASDGHITSMHKAKKDRKLAPVAAPSVLASAISSPTGAIFRP